MKQKLLTALYEYKTYDSREAEHVKYALAYIEANDNCFDRTTNASTIFDSELRADVTASAWLISPDHKSVLFTHHKKLSIWIPLGGHCDGEEDVLAIALKEAEEESGIQGIKPISEDILDIDIQKIPAGSDGTPEHQHIDIRFILHAPHADYTVSDESNDLRWISIGDVPLYNKDHAILRACKKWTDLIQHDLAQAPKPLI